MNGRTPILSSLDRGAIVIDSFVVTEGDYLSALDVYVGGRVFGTLDIHVVDALEEVPQAYLPTVHDSGDGFQIIDMDSIPPSFSGPSAPEGVGVIQQALSCGNGINGPGITDFWSSSPGYSGQGFSYKPEGGGSLVWATNGEKAADGLYRIHWGCGTALKVPNNCTEYVKQDTTLQYCCGFPQWNTPSWVNTYNDAYFDDCPLFF